MDPVEAAASRIRDLVNSPRRVHFLLQNTQRWYQLCSAMDAIGDTQMAARAYFDDKVDDDRSEGFSYLIVYGILQVLYAQQDAAKMLASCLGLKLALPPEIRAIREIRNDAVGHAVVRGVFISRMSLSTKGFALSVRDSRPTGVDLRTVAAQQTEVMGQFLERVAEQLVSDELEHRRKFRDRPIKHSLPEVLSYYAVKISEGMRNASDRPLALGCITFVREAVTASQKLIAERELTEAYKDSVGRTASEIEFALTRIESRLNGGAATWTAADEDVYWWYFNTKITELRELAAEIDREYDSDDVT